LSNFNSTVPDTNPEIDRRKEQSPHNSANGEGVKIRSYASLVEHEEGATLKYAPTMNINGVECAKLEECDVAKC